MKVVLSALLFIASVCYGGERIYDHIFIYYAQPPIPQDNDTSVTIQDSAESEKEYTPTVKEKEGEQASRLTITPNFKVTDLGNNWYQHDQFGTFYDKSDSDWYYHLDHGWIYVKEWDDNGTWMYVPLGDEIGNDETESSIMSESIALGWMWSKSEHYPQLYNNELQDWMYFNKDRNESKYYCYSLKRYLTKDFITKFSVSEKDWKSLEPLFFWDGYKDYDYSPLYDSELTSAGTWNVTIPKEELDLDDNWSSTIKSILEVANEAEKRGIIDIQDAGEFYKFKFGTASAAVTAGHILESIESDILLKEKESFHENNYNPYLGLLKFGYIGNKKWDELAGTLDELAGTLSGGLDLNPTGSLISSNDNNSTSSFLSILGALTGSTGLSDVDNNDFLNVDIPMKNVKLDTANVTIGKQGEDTSVDVSSNLTSVANHDDRKILLFGAAKDLTIAGDTTFTNTNNVEDHALVLGAADELYFRSEYSSANSADYSNPEPISFEYTGSNLGLGSESEMRLINVDIRTGGNLAIASLDKILIDQDSNSSMSTFTVGISGKNSDPHNVYMYASNLIAINGLAFQGNVDDIYMDSTTIDLSNVNFPANTEVMIRIRDGRVNFLTNQLGHANLSKVTHASIDNTRILTSQDFEGSAGHYDSVAKNPNGSPYIKIRSR